ncbi:hypothetical protein [Streptomyces sp. NPDC058667]|uniref:hypothetical protein n=1 Tax=Streptomyces sp. NPDC058667 TaxID=3346588 RepID=UPI00366237FB
MTRYSNGQIVPPAEYIDHLVRELRERSTFQPDAETSLYRDYGELLDHLASRPRSHPMHRLMRAVFVAQQHLRGMAQEHSAVVRDMGHAQQDLKDAIRDRDRERELRLRARVEQLRERENELALRRKHHLARLDEARGELARYDTGQQTAHGSELGTVHTHLPQEPPGTSLSPRQAHPPAAQDGPRRDPRAHPPRAAGTTPRAWFLTGLIIVIGVLIGGFSVLAVVLKDNDDGKTPAPDFSTVTANPQPTASRQPSAEPSPEQDPLTALDEHLTGIFEITVGDGNTLDIEGQRLDAPGAVAEFRLDFGRLFFETTTKNVAQNVGIGWIDNRDVPACENRARLEDRKVLHLSDGDHQTQSVCVLTSSGKWALLQVAETKPSSAGIGIGDVRFRVGYLKN